jgi:translation initiation factor 4G
MKAFSTRMATSSQVEISSESIFSTDVKKSSSVAGRWTCPTSLKVNLARKDPEAVMLSDEYYIAAAAKRRGLGLVQFIGELYKLSMLTERIMHECVKKLVDYTGIPDEAEIESLTKLLKTIGGNLDSTEKGKPMMDVYFTRIQSMIDTPELPSRLRFMLMDIVDLRKKRWQSKEDNKGPKTLGGSPS